MAESYTGCLTSADLEQALGRTMIGGYTKNIDNIILNGLNDPSENVFIADMSYIFGEIPELKQRYINTYRGVMGNVKNVEYIPEDLAALQAALFDGLCFGYDTTNGSYALYTMNFNLLMDTSDLDIKYTKQCMDKNVKGEVKCYRLDVEYDNSSDSFNFKLVTHRKVMDVENILFAPYLYVLRLMRMVESYISTGNIFCIRQDKDGVMKERYVCSNPSIMATFSGVSGRLQPAYFPLKGFFYAPVLGAPSTSSMVTNVNMFDMYYIGRRGEGDVQRAGIKPVKNPVKNMLLERSIITSIMDLYTKNPDETLKLLRGIPHRENLISDSELTSGKLSLYLHSLTVKEEVAVCKMIPGATERFGRFSMFDECAKPIPDISKENLQHVLNENLCRVIIRKKDCSLSSMVCTNNKEMLAMVYGDDYYGKYESFTPRFYGMIDLLKKGISPAEATKKMGFEGMENIIQEYRGRLYTDPNEFTEDLCKAFKEALGIRTGRTTGNDYILARSIEGYITPRGVEEYYKNIDPSKIVDAIILA